MKISKRLLEEGFFKYKKRNPQDCCWVKGCNKKRKGKTPLCHRHYQQRWRGLNPKKSAYATLRDHAKARRLPFTITLEYWEGLVDGLCFFNHESDEVMTIDRVDATKGYEKGNLRVVTMSVNVAKGNRERYLPEHVQSMVERKRQEKLSEYEHYLEDERDNGHDEVPF